MGVFYFLDDQCLHFGGIFQGFGVCRKEPEGDVGAGFRSALIWIFPSLALGRNDGGKGGENPRLV